MGLTFTDLRVWCFHQLFRIRISIAKSTSQSLSWSNRAKGSAKRSEAVRESVWLIQTVHLRTGSCAAVFQYNRIFYKISWIFIYSTVGNWTLMSSIMSMMKQLLMEHAACERLLNTIDLIWWGWGAETPLLTDTDSLYCYLCDWRH